MTDAFFQTPFPAAPDLVPMTRIACDVDPLVSLGDAPAGERRYVPLSGGIVQGPEINGHIRAGGVDWQVARRDGVLEIAAHYVIETGRPSVSALVNMIVSQMELAGHFPNQPAAS